jgi:hypothetical protein
MSATVNAPFGLRPSYSPSGVIRPTAFTIASGYAQNLFQNQPVRIAPTTTGGETEGNLVAAAVGAAFIGVFQGVEFTDGEGRRRVSNRWLASTVATEITAYATLDPTIFYEIQSNAALTVADIGKQYDLPEHSGSGRCLRRRQCFCPSRRHHARPGQRLRRHLCHRAGSDQRTSVRC